MKPYLLFVLMIRRPPRSTLTDTLFPDTTLFLSPTSPVATCVTIAVPATREGDISVKANRPMVINTPPGPTAEMPIPAANEISNRSEEHTSELQSLMRTSYAVFCLKNKKKTTTTINSNNNLDIPDTYIKTNK